jgi:hypothetical protein
MAVVEVHTGIITGPKHAVLSDGAFRLWAHGLCWSKEHLTDGFIPAVTLPLLHPKAARVLPELLRTLVPGKGPLWHEADGGYTIHDYEQWQETKGRVQERRQQWRDRKNKQRNHISEQLATLRELQAGHVRDKDDESRVTPAYSPSDGSGGGRGRGNRSPKPPSGADALFGRFWEAYPRHTGKANAEKAWRKIDPDEDLIDTMLAALAWQRRQPSWTKDAGAFIPHPATWLNQRRWEDEHPDGALNGTSLDYDYDTAPIGQLPKVEW